MIEKTIKTTQGHLKIKIPDKLDEITLGQMMELQEKSTVNDLEAISILSGISLSLLQNVTLMDDLQVFAAPLLSLASQIKYLYNSDKIPKTITFTLHQKKITVNVIRNLSVEPAGAFFAARDIISDEISEHIKSQGEENWGETFNPSLKACCQVLAHYFYCRATGKPYHEYEAEAFCDEIKKLRVTEALPIGKYFFTCFPALSKPKISYWHRLQQRWRKKPAYKPSKNLNISTL